MRLWASRLQAAIDLRREPILRMRAAATSLSAAARSWRTDRTELRRAAKECCGVAGGYGRVVEQQAALRHVATQVARGLPPSVVFETVAGESGRLLKADYTAILRYEPDRTVSALAHWSDPDVPDIPTPAGGRWAIENTAAATVLRTGEPGRCESVSITGEIGAWLRSRGISHAVACPITVEDHLWGAMSFWFRDSEPPPVDTEKCIREFVQLAACTIAQAESRAELIASRARVVASTDAARHRLERNLHDGAQQHLISLALELRAAEANLPPEQEELRQQLATTVQGLSDVLAELQEVSHGLHPTILARGGLEAALTTRTPIPGAC